MHLKTFITTFICYLFNLDNEIRDYLDTGVVRLKNCLYVHIYGAVKKKLNLSMYAMFKY